MYASFENVKESGLSVEPLHRLPLLFEIVRNGY